METRNGTARHGTAHHDPRPGAAGRRVCCAYSCQFRSKGRQGCPPRNATPCPVSPHRRPPPRLAHRHSHKEDVCPSSRGGAGRAITLTAKDWTGTGPDRRGEEGGGGTRHPDVIDSVSARVVGSCAGSPPSRWTLTRKRPFKVDRHSARSLGLQQLDEARQRFRRQHDHYINHIPRRMKFPPCFSVTGALQKLQNH